MCSLTFILSELNLWISEFCLSPPHRCDVVFVLAFPFYSGFRPITSPCTAPHSLSCCVCSISTRLMYKVMKRLYENWRNTCKKNHFYPTCLHCGGGVLCAVGGTFTVVCFAAYCITLFTMWARLYEMLSINLCFSYIVFISECSGCFFVGLSPFFPLRTQGE